MKPPLIIATLVLLWAGGQTQTGSAQTASPSQPKQGANLLKVDILGVFAHPDDETGMAATTARYALGEGKVVAHVYCTRGEGGGNMVGTHWGPALGILREAELRDCLDRLGVRYCYFLDQLDWAYTESVSATLRKWGKEETLRRLVRHIRALRPDVIVTMNPAPAPGQHGHHQAAGLLATEAFEAAADPNRFPEQITDEGLTPWQVRKLYYPGSVGRYVATITTTNALADGRNPARIAGEALANHRSQGFGGFGNSSFLGRPQKFTLVKTAVPSAGAENDLLQGLPVSDAQAQPLALDEPPPQPPALELRFVPRPAIANYQAWIKQQRIQHVAARFAADLPVLSGASCAVRLEAVNRGGSAVEGQLHLAAPEGWRWEKAILPFSVAPSQTITVEARLTAPAGERADGEISATAQIAGDTVKAVASAHPVPRGRVVRLEKAPPVDATGKGWEKVTATFISPTNLVQGRVSSEADSSAWFRLAYDGLTLFVDVEVKDDYVVSNIAPNDIRGHWRSDSVEICVDPVAGAEDTMGCFKLGIFPFDTTGVVRAERDADANQGPIEKTAPGTRVASRRTAGGYRVQAAIPLREIGLSLDTARKAGFNLIVYDGDKEDAAVGENINKSRIAWAPRPGVNGRPEDWGRVDFE